MMSKLYGDGEYCQGIGIQRYVAMDVARIQPVRGIARGWTRSKGSRRTIETLSKPCS